MADTSTVTICKSYIHIEILVCLRAKKQVSERVVPVCHAISFLLHIPTTDFICQISHNRSNSLLRKPFFSLRKFVSFDTLY